MPIKLNFIIAVWKLVPVLDFTFRIRQAGGSWALVRVGCVPHRFNAAFALVCLSPEDTFERHGIFGDGHAVGLDGGTR